MVSPKGYWVCDKHPLFFSGFIKKGFKCLLCDGVEVSIAEQVDVVEQLSFYRAAYDNLSEVNRIDRRDHAVEIQSLKDFYFKWVLAALIVGVILGGLIVLVSIYFPGIADAPLYIR